MAAQASTLYSTNIRHFLTDLTPKKDGVIVHNMEDDVIRGATVTHEGAVTYPPPPPRCRRSPRPSRRKAEGADTGGEAGPGSGRLQEPDPDAGGPLALEAQARWSEPMRRQASCPTDRLRPGLLRGFPGDLERQPFAAYAPYGGHQRDPGIIVLGALLQVGSGNWLVVSLAAVSILIATINLVGGFLVTRRMLAMFQKSRRPQ